MRSGSTRGRFVTLSASALIALSCVVSSSRVEGAKPSDEGPVPLTVSKATCGPGDHPETALQGQVPAALRASGFKGFNCNLELIGQSRGEGANWQTTEFSQGNHVTCAYHGTASPALSLPGRQHLGVPTIDITHPDNP